MTKKYYQDSDHTETQEWVEAFESVLESQGPERARFLLKVLTQQAQQNGLNLTDLNTAYVNTIAPADEAPLPGDPFMERRIRSLVRWNAMAMVLRANDNSDELGGHIASFASSATLYDVGFNYFFRAPHDDFLGDSIYYQGHCSPGIYARSFLEGRLTEDQLDHFRRETEGGLSSYPHPWLMPDYWQFPTVSMGLGPMTAIYQGLFMRYLHHRELVAEKGRKIWAFLGDGEMDEPESTGAISLAGREGLDNLVFVVNCNLQRLDGPVRGNGKIIQELENTFRGAGWHVIKVVWGRMWDSLLQQDHTGALHALMNETLDGDFQAFKTHGGAYTRENFFNKHPETAKMVEHMSDEDIYRLNRGGHDPFKVFAAYHEAVNHTGQPVVILAKTVKGYGMGEAAEGINKAHQVKKVDIESLKGFRDRFDMPFTDDQLKDVPYYKPRPNSPELKYLQQRREALGGYLPQRQQADETLEVPELGTFGAQLEGSGDRKFSTTMAFVRMLSTLLKSKSLGERVVPIVPDEARTFGMEGMFRQLGIYSSKGQQYRPEDADQMMYYREDVKGRMLEAGINEAGAFSAWIAAGTSYSTNLFTMVPFYIFYSMFGFQRVGDLAWAAGDAQTRGFLIGATAGRTTLNGEGLQHQDGHSQLLASTIPNCVAYDPCYAYELAVIIHSGLERMYHNKENVYYYVTTMNENYAHPAMPEGSEYGIIKGMYLLQEGDHHSERRVNLFGSGVILREVEAAAQILRDVYDVTSDVWSITSYNELARDATEVARWNSLHPEQEQKESHLSDCLRGKDFPVIAASDYMRAVPDQISPFVRGHYVSLGTDGFGRSDTRQNLRRHFEVDRYYIVLTALNSLADKGRIGRSKVVDAIKRFEIDADKINPLKS